MKKMNDMKRFEELLSSDSALTNYDFDGGSNYITQQQENENIDASCKCLTNDDNEFYLQSAV